jgi:hypothetical protein
MPRIKSKDLLDKVSEGTFTCIKIKGLQNGKFCMTVESLGEVFIHENVNGSIKEYNRVEDAIRWLKRKSEVKEVIVDIELWRDDIDK